MSLMRNYSKPPICRQMCSLWGESFIVKKLRCILITLAIIPVPSLLEAASLNADVTVPDYWMPAEPPGVQYKIDCSPDPGRRLLKAQETVRFTNATSEPIRTLALMCSADGSQIPEITGNGKPVVLLTGAGSNPVVFSLAESIAPAETVTLDVKFRLSIAAQQESPGKTTIVKWHPRLWCGYEMHGSYDVKLDVPDEYAVAASGLLDTNSGRYHAEAAPSFGLIIAEGHSVLKQRAGDVLVRCLYRPELRECAQLLIAAAVDVIDFYRQRFGFYPYKALTIIPGSDRPMGGYPVAPTIVAIHSMHRFDEKPRAYWQWIIAHEIGHQYWGEYVLEKDNPGWLWIGLGIYADREYSRARNLGSQRHREFIDAYTAGVRSGYDTTMNISQEQLSGIGFDFNSVVIHGKGYSVISALDCVLGRDVFDRIYRRCLKDFAGRRLGAREFQAVCEEETGRDLEWFFEQWMNSNRCLSYDITAKACEKQGDSYISRIRVERLGDLKMPVPLVARFAEGTSQQRMTDRLVDIGEYTFESSSPLESAQLDPQGVLALVAQPPSTSDQQLRSEIQKLPWLGAGERALQVFKRMKIGELSDSFSWLKLGLTLYDGKHYEEALEAFQLTEELEQPNSSARAFASVVWQGHINDLLGRRQEALEFYKKALSMPGDHEMRHDQYGIRLSRRWVRDRLERSFRRD